MAEFDHWNKRKAELAAALRRGQDLAAPETNLSTVVGVMWVAGQTVDFTGDTEMQRVGGALAGLADQSRLADTNRVAAAPDEPAKERERLATLVALVLAAQQWPFQDQVDSTRCVSRS